MEAPSPASGRVSASALGGGALPSAAAPVDAAQGATNLNKETKRKRHFDNDSLCHLVVKSLMVSAQTRGKLLISAQAEVTLVM